MPTVDQINLMDSFFLSYSCPKFFGGNLSHVKLHLQTVSETSKRIQVRCWQRMLHVSLYVVFYQRNRKREQSLKSPSLQSYVMTRLCALKESLRITYKRKRMHLVVVNSMSELALYPIFSQRSSNLQKVCSFFSVLPQ